jgi:hypothetical protein
MNLESLPEWSSALATSGVFVTALTLMRGVHDRPRNAELSLAAAEVERRRSITNHFLDILDDADSATTEALSAFNIEQADPIYYKHYALFQAVVRTSTSRIKRPQLFSGLPMDIYCLCDRVGVILTAPRLSA